METDGLIKPTEEFSKMVRQRIAVFRSELYMTRDTGQETELELRDATSLRNALSRFVEGWRDDLSEAWRSVLNDVEPAVRDVGEELTFSTNEPIFPARRERPHTAARPDAHVFRAFDGIQPAEVRCVLLGQDPYPSLERATGRSFEQGEGYDWASMKISQSMCGLLQMLAEHRTEDPDYRGKGGLRRALKANDVNIEPPSELFDRWRDQGVLCLNTGLTLTRYVRGGAKEQLQGHIPFWRPVVAGVMRFLARRTDGQVVFLLLGKHAWKIADLTGIQAEAQAAGTWGRSVGEARPYHPSFRGSKRNGLIEANDQFAAMGVDGIDW